MADSVYERLADALDRLPNGFPKTSSRVEIEILKRIFSPDEAFLAGSLSGRMEAVDSMAERAGLPVAEVGAKLADIAGRDLIWSDRQTEDAKFRLAPFVVGIFESQLHNMDHELAHLFEDYMAEGGAAGIMKPDPPLHRVVPARGSVKSEWILPYDDVRAILMGAKAFCVRDCICRVQQDLVGRQCSFPSRVCLSFSFVDRPPRPDDISQAEALAILDRTEEIGLVHTVSNIMKGISYICNCCGCCCGILRGITHWGIENSVAHANYYSVIDPDRCLGCGTCMERCQVHAISEPNGVAVVDLKRCIGCGLCVTGCPNGAAMLERKLEAEIVHPPANYRTWERERLVNRGLAE